MSTAKPQTKQGSNPAMTRGNAYHRCKKDNSCLSRLPSQAHSEKMRLMSVSDLAMAAEYVLDASKKSSSSKKSFRIQQNLIDNLKETIKLREAVGATYANDSDDGHQHIIETLKYCHAVLCSSRVHLQRGATSETGSGSRAEMGRYGILSDDDSDHEDQEAEEDLDDLPRPNRPSEPLKDYSIENDLCNGSLAFQANLFFLTAETLFDTVIDAYETLKQRMTALLESNLDSKKRDHQVMIHLMQATATVNLAIEYIRYLENSFFLESSQLDNIYDVFAVLNFQDTVLQLEEIFA